MPKRQHSKLLIPEIQNSVMQISEEVNIVDEKPIRELTPKEISELESIQIRPLKPDQLRALRPEQIQALTQGQIKALRLTQIQALLPNQIAALTENQKLWLRQNKVLQKVEQVSELSISNPYFIILFNIDEIQALSQHQFALLKPAHIWALKTVQIQSLTQVQMQALKLEQIGALKTAQIQALLPHQISWLKPEQIGALTKLQISWLTQVQMQALKLEQIAALTAVQLKELIINILIKSYNTSNKTTEDFQEKLGKYSFLEVINRADSIKAFDFMHRQGKDSPAEQFQWFNGFIQGCVTQILGQQELNAEKPPTCWTSSIYTTTQLSLQL